MTCTATEPYERWATFLLVRLAFLSAVAAAGFLLFHETTAAHGTCRTHHEYQTYDGTHDADGDGVGCETLPPPPSGESPADDTSSGVYDRDHWSFDSSSARAELGCSRTEHVDHVVALKEAYDSGAANWTNRRKAEFANDRDNLWCLDASVNISKSDHDLAEWDGGTCAQRQHIAQVTVSVKVKYKLTIDAAEQTAIEIAQATTCDSADEPDSPPSDADQIPVVDLPVSSFPEGRIVARRLEDGRTEFGYQPRGRERMLPRSRFFPPAPSVSRWLYSSEVRVGERVIGRISARLLVDGRIEFSLVTVDGQRVLPGARFFPRTSSGRWLSSSLIGAND